MRSTLMTVLALAAVTAAGVAGCGGDDEKPPQATKPAETEKRQPARTTTGSTSPRTGDKAKAGEDAEERPGPRGEPKDSPNQQRRAKKPADPNSPREIAEQACRRGRKAQLENRRQKLEDVAARAPQPEQRQRARKLAAALRCEDR